MAAEATNDAAFKIDGTVFVGRSRDNDSGDVLSFLGGVSTWRRLGGEYRDVAISVGVQRRRVGVGARFADLPPHASLEKHCPE